MGRNLQDHLLFGVGYQSRRDLPFPALLAEAGMFLYTGPAPDSAAPDLQFFFGPIQFVADEYKVDGPGFTFAPILAQPRSRGTVGLRSADATDLPVVDPHYLRRRGPRRARARHLDRRELAHTSAFDGLRGRELAPGPAVPNLLQQILLGKLHHHALGAGRDERCRHVDQHGPRSPQRRHRNVGDARFAGADALEELFHDAFRSTNT